MDTLLSHIALIMDGNSRWAANAGLPKIEGYKVGASVAMSIVDCCLNLKIPFLTLYAFSSENFHRNEDDIRDFFNLFEDYCTTNKDELHKKGVFIRFIGDFTNLPINIFNLINSINSFFVDNTTKIQLNVVIAFSYGGRQEILNAIKQIILQNIKVEELNIELINSLLYTYPAPEPDLIIRTSGEKRLSNFLLWQSAYSELYFCDVLWPDFTLKHFESAIEDYKKRVRRYGK